jgi:hypothetical protein
MPIRVEFASCILQVLIWKSSNFSKSRSEAE